MIEYTFENVKTGQRLKARDKKDLMKRYKIPKTKATNYWYNTEPIIHFGKRKGDLIHL